MRKLRLLPLLMLLCCLPARAQDSTRQRLRPPATSDYSSGVSGDCYWNTSSTLLRCYSGGSWHDGGGTSLPVSDATAFVKGSGDATKLLRFEVDGFTTGTTRVLTPPNYDGTIATLAGAETFTNKTLTTPTIASFANATHDHTNAAGGGQLALSAFSSTTGSGAVVGAISPAFTSTPTAPTAAVDTNTTQLATTAFVIGQAYAKLASPTFTGTPSLPTSTTAVTQSAADSTTKLATTAFVTTADNLKANLISPSFTTPTLGAASATSLDTALLNPTGNVVEQRNGANSQTFRVYSTYTDASNYERVTYRSSTSPAIFTEAAGTGTARSFYIGTGGAASLFLITGNTERWSINSSGHLLAFTDNAPDIGDPTHRARSIYAGTSVVTASITINGGTALTNYTESTWTPAVTFGGGSTGITYTTQRGDYTRVGNLVTATLTVTLSAKGSSTGQATVSLPVAASSTANVNQVCVVRAASITYTGQVLASIFPASNTVITIEQNNAGTITGLTDTAFSATTSLVITCSYRL